MKRAELEIGKEYAYSRYSSKPTRAYEVSRIVITDTTSNQFHTQEVKGRFIDKEGVPNENIVWLSTRKIIGDYQTIIHEFEIDEKNAEINRLKKEIRAKENAELIERLAPEWKEYGISKWDIRVDGYGSNTVKVSMTIEQLNKISNVLRYHPIYEERLEQMRTEIDTLKNPTPSLEVVA